MCYAECVEEQHCLYNVLSVIKVTARRSMTLSTYAIYEKCYIFMQIIHLIWKEEQSKASNLGQTEVQQWN